MNLISEENYEFNDIVLHKYSYIYVSVTGNKKV